MMEHVRRGAARAGRDASTLEVVARFQVVVTDDPASARGAIRHMLGPYFATSVYNRFAAWCGFEDEAREILAAWQAKDRARNLAAVTDDMIDRIAIIGTADECRRKLRAFHEAGVTTPMVHPFLFDERAMSAVLEGLAPNA
jgi:alkanesulfonate monooxygenase SsuD/methylene tetrahydromethanopterin reductase-like flavin-dependent oxidoreductase (luciferase family)